MAPLLLLTGATGYVGGAVLDGLVKWDGGVEITAIARKPEAVATISAAYAGVRVVQAGYGDAEFARLVARADIIVHAGDSADDVPSAHAIADNVKDGAFVLHTSGTGILIDNAELDLEITKEWDDEADIGALTSWPADRPHRNIEALILGLHDRKPRVNTLIVSPSLVYGLGGGKLNRASQQIPYMIKFAAALGKNAVYGSGKAIWSSVHVDDLVDLYVLILATYLSSPDRLHLNADGLYLVGSGSQSWRSITAALDAPLVKHGVISPDRTANVGTPDERHYTDAELAQLGDKSCKLAKWIFASNSACRSTRARRLGWRPQHTEVFSTLDAEVLHFKQFGPPR